MDPYFHLFYQFLGSSQGQDSTKVCQMLFCNKAEKQMYQVKILLKKIHLAIR